MSSVGVPDILSGLRLARAQRDVKARLEVAQIEMTTGEAADRVAATRGDPYRLYSLDTEIARIDSRLPLLEMAKSRSAGIQTALESAETALGDYPVKLLGFATIGDAASAKTLARDAKAILGQVMSALNVDVAGRHVFGGDEADAAPLAAADDLLNHVRDLFANGLFSNYDASGAGVPGDEVLLGGNPLARDEALAHYFGVDFGSAEAAFVNANVASQSDRLFSERDAGSGLTPTAIYTGGLNDPPSVELATTERLDYGVTADDPAIRELIMNLSVIVIAGEVESGDAMLASLETAATGVIAAADKITELRSEVGLNESRIENALALNQAEKNSLELARGRLIARDPYDSATHVTELESQLQMIYAMTARASRLSLLNYL
jgi:flagellar hook-associated protein 3 FlgL